MAKPKTILYLYGGEFWMRSRRMSGIFSFAGQSGMRLKSAALDTLGIGLREALEVFRPDGCVVETGLVARRRMKPSDFPVPVVVCDVTDAQRAAGFTGVRHDPEAACSVAIDALLGLGWNDLAFAGGWISYDWEDVRRRHFASRVRAAGRTAHFLPRTDARGRRRFPAYVAALRSWVAALPRPCAVLAANDEVGGYVLDAAARASRAVPDSLAVVGIDNDEMLCEGTVPTLASIAPDFERSGRLAAELLAGMMDAPGARPECISYGAGPLHRRESLRPFTVYDEAAARASAWIREHCTERIDVAAVAAAMGLRPRMAETRFLRFTGRTIFGEIEDARFHRACRLLRDPKNKIDAVAAACGYGSGRAFRGMFAKKTGLSPRQWRQEHC